MPLEKTNLSLQIEKPSNEEPKDTYWIIYYLFSLLGLVHILPWTFFVTANDYWMNKFRNTSISYGDDPNYKTVLQREFSPFITTSLQLSTIAFFLLALFFGHKFKLKLKVIGTLVGILLCFIVATVFIFVDTDGWQTLFFVITMLTVAVINSLNAIFGLSAMEIVSNFPRIYLGSYLTGLGLATVFTSLLQLFALAIGISTEGSALVYFWTATGIIAIIVCILMMAFSRNKFFQFHVRKSLEVRKEKMMKFDRIIYLYKKIWPGGALMAFWVVATVTVHPCITTLVVSEGAGTSVWNDKYFLPVVTFVLVAILDYLGRIAAQKIKIQVKPVNLVIFSAIRMLIFIPLVMLCNAQPRNNFPVVFHHDYQYIIIMSVSAVSSGYIGYMVQYIIPQLVHPEEIEDALQLNTVTIAVITGIFSFLPFVSVGII